MKFLIYILIFLFVQSAKCQVYPSSLANVKLGYDAGANLTSGSNNTLLGAGSGNKVSIGSDNTFVGFLSGYYTTTGKGNIFVGSNAGIYNNTGEYNAFIGYKAGYNNTSGINNAVLGAYAYLYPKIGENNTIIGYYAGKGIYTSSYTHTTIIGDYAGYNLITGSNSVIIGSLTGYNLQTAYNSILIGANPQVNSIYDTINIGDTFIIDKKNNEATLYASLKLMNVLEGEGKNLVIGTDNKLYYTKGQIKICHEIPQGEKNQQNLVFSLAHTPIINTEMIYLNGILLMPGSDYNMNGNQINFSYPPYEGDILQACYEFEQE